MDSFTKYTTIITISLAVGGSIFGSINWIDNRYGKHQDFASVTYKILVSSYTHQISTLNSRLLYLLEFEHTNKSEIQETKKQIQILKSERKEMLSTGHVNHGNSIHLNNVIVRDKFIKD